MPAQAGILAVSRCRLGRNKWLEEEQIGYDFPSDLRLRMAEVAARGGDDDKPLENYGCSIAFPAVCHHSSA